MSVKDNYLIGTNSKFKLCLNRFFIKNHLNIQIGKMN